MVFGPGFHEIADNKVLVGDVDSVNSDVASDGDWCFHVRPAAGYEDLLTNHQGHTNTNGLIECEVQPPDRVYGGGNRNDIFRRYMTRFQGQRVQVVGTWVADCAHSYDGRDCPVYNRCCDQGKTEIHPIISILAWVPPPEGAIRRLELFVFLDCASRWFHQPPHSQTSQIGNFRVPIGLVGTPGQTRAEYHIVSEVNMAESRDLHIFNDGTSWVFSGTVVSGTDDQGKGFYQGTVDLYYFAGKKLGLSSRLLSFTPPVPVGSSLVETVGVRNEGNEPLSVTVGGPPAGSQFQWAPFSRTLAVSQSQQIPVTFRPNRIGSIAGSLIVTSDAPGSPHSVSLTGRGCSPECPGILEQMEVLEKKIEDAQEQLREAPPNAKQGLIRRIREAQAELGTLSQRAHELEC